MHTEVTESGRYYQETPEGKSLALVFVKGALTAEDCNSASDILRLAATKINGRSHQVGGGEPVLTGVVGHYDYTTSPTLLHQRCRLSAFTRRNLDALNTDASPVIRALDKGRDTNILCETF